MPSSTPRVIQTQGVDLAVKNRQRLAAAREADEPETHDVNGSQENRDGNDMDGLHQWGQTSSPIETRR